MSEIAPYISPNRRRVERRIAATERTLAILQNRLEILKKNDPPPLDKLCAWVVWHAGLVCNKDLIGKNRSRSISDIRCIFIHIAIDLYGHSRKEVARFLKRDPATITYSLKSFSGKALESEFRDMAGALEHNVAIGLKRDSLRSQKATS
jgi:hypothetical protein